MLPDFKTLNSEGLAWCEWFAAATLGHTCCSPDAWGACSSKCPRVSSRYASPVLVKAWRDGEDPTEYAVNGMGFQIQATHAIVGELIAEEKAGR